MRRVIGSIIVLFLLGGLFVKYRDGRSLMARPGTQGTANAGDVLSDPPNWKVELANPSFKSRTPNRISTPPRSTVATAKYGSNSVNGSNPPTWSRRKGVFPPAAPAYLPRDSSIVPPHAIVLSKPAQQPAIPPTPKPASDQSVVTTPGRPNARVLWRHDTRAGCGRIGRISGAAASCSVPDQGGTGSDGQGALAADSPRSRPGRRSPEKLA